jgi:hypothetical protein
MVQSQTTSITPSIHADTHRTGGTDPLTGVVGINSLMKDYAEGISLTTDSGWTTPASDLTKATDGDNDTHTGEAITAVADDVEIEKLDLGSLVDPTSVTVAVDAYQHWAIRPWWIYVEVSPDDSAWTEVGKLTIDTGDDSQKVYFGVFPVPLTIRYVRLRMLNGNQTYTAKAKIHYIRII